MALIYKTGLDISSASPYHGALATWQANAIWVSFVAGQETRIVENVLLPDRETRAVRYQPVW
jgi:hypothetical protein